VTRCVCSGVNAGFPPNVRNRWEERQTPTKEHEDAAAASEGPTECGALPFTHIGDTL